MEQGLAAISAAVQPLQLADSTHGGSAATGPVAELPAAAAEPGVASGTARSSGQRQLWHQQVALQLLAKVSCRCRSSAGNLQEQCFR